MKSTIQKKHLITPEDLPLYDLRHIFSAGTFWFESGMKDAVATFDLFVRNTPPKRNFLVFGGLDEITRGVLNWRYSEEDVKYLLYEGIITPGFANYLKKFKFSGSISAMPEGTIFFGGEPVVRVTAPLIEANTITMFLMNSLCGNTIFLSKIIRNVIASNPKPCIGVAGLRAQSFESAFKCARASYIAGAIGGNSVPSVAKKLGKPFRQPLSFAYHAVISSFPTEIEAMRKMAKLFKGKIGLMVDTYDFKQGVENAIIVAKELKRDNMSVCGITIDSGNLAQRCFYVRKRLDAEGLNDVKITLASNLDEYTISRFNKNRVPVDAFLIATEAISVSDSPKLEVVYKISQIQHKGKTKNLAKFSAGKESYPGEKQVFRMLEKDKYVKDVIGLEGEKLGKPLLVPIINNGKQVYELPDLDEIRAYVASQLKQLPERYLRVDKEYKYPIDISPKLKKMFEEVRKEYL